jgi:excinuclease UvrABC ATPase subunit
MSHYFQRNSPGQYNHQPEPPNNQTDPRTHQALNESDSSIESRHQSKINWNDRKLEKRFFEKFEKVDQLMDEKELQHNKARILKRVKTCASHRACINLNGYRSRLKAKIVENKNFKLQSIPNCLYCIPLNSLPGF